MIICIEMQWQGEKLFLFDRVCVIIQPVSDISACLYIYIYTHILLTGRFLAENDNLSIFLNSALCYYHLNQGWLHFFVGWPRSIFSHVVWTGYFENVHQMVTAKTNV